MTDTVKLTAKQDGTIELSDVFKEGVSDTVDAMGDGIEIMTG